MDTVKANEIRESANAAAVDYVKARIQAGKDGSPSVGLVHAGMLVHVMNEIKSLIETIIDLKGTSEEQEKFCNEALFIAFAEVENGSAYRQKLEKAGVLAKTSKAAAMAADYL